MFLRHVTFPNIYTLTRALIMKGFENLFYLPKAQETNDKKERYRKLESGYIPTKEKVGI